MNSPAVPFHLGVLISGGGRTLIHLDDRIRAGNLKAVIDVVVSSRADAPGLSRARERGLQSFVSERRMLSDEAFHRSILEHVKEVDLVCMAGFQSFWRIPKEFQGRVINIHPALLPDFGGPGMFGLRVHEAVLTARMAISGCTVHYCDNEYDHGPIILQRTVQVSPDDTPVELAARVFEQECIAYPLAIQMIAEGCVRWRDGRVIFAPETEPSLPKEKATR